MEVRKGGVLGRLGWVHGGVGYGVLVCVGVGRVVVCGVW